LKEAKKKKMTEIKKRLEVKQEYCCISAECLSCEASRDSSCMGMAL
jgi:hypothetical protein